MHHSAARADHRGTQFLAEHRADGAAGQGRRWARADLTAVLPPRDDLGRITWRAGAPRIETGDLLLVRTRVPHLVPTRSTAPGRKSATLRYRRHRGSQQQHYGALSDLHVKYDLAYNNPTDRGRSRWSQHFLHTSLLPLLGLPLGGSSGPSTRWPTTAARRASAAGTRLDLGAAEHARWTGAPRREMKPYPF